MMTRVDPDIRIDFLKVLRAKKSKEFLLRKWTRLSRCSGPLRAYRENVASLGARILGLKAPRKVPHIYSQKSTLQFVRPALDNSFYQNGSKEGRWVRFTS